MSSSNIDPGPQRHELRVRIGTLFEASATGLVAVIAVPLIVVGALGAKALGWW